jgi:hypothetical protein
MVVPAFPAIASSQQGVVTEQRKALSIARTGDSLEETDHCDYACSNLKYQCKCVKLASSHLKPSPIVVYGATGYLNSVVPY